MVNRGVLLIDIGNTNMKWCRWNGSELSPKKHLSHRDRPVNELAAAAFQAEEMPQRVVLANVAEAEILAGINRWISQAWGVDTRVISVSAEACGVTNGYRDPGQLGVDRWLALIAAYRLQLTPACIVDCGTAITIDVIDGEGRHHGGLVLAGFNLMRNALLGGTRIPRVEDDSKLQLLAKDTAGGVAAASLHAAAALVERVMQRVQADGEDYRLLLTGSDAARLQAALNIPSEIHENLVMRGLAELADAGFRQ